VQFKEFVTLALYCGIPVEYSFKLKSGDPLPKFITADTNSNSKGGYLEIYLSTRKGLGSTMWTVLITGQVPKENPPNVLNML
jgi:hypothetical protein